MPFTEEQNERLAAPLDASRIKTKPGGRKNRYLETYDVQATANLIFGFDGWSQEQVELRCLGEHQIHRPTEELPDRRGWIVGYRCTMRIRVGEKVSEDTGYGDAIEYADNPITCHELAAKEAVSDAIKRAFKAMGDQFGLCLYDKTGGAAGGASQTQPAAARARNEGDTPTGAAPVVGAISQPQLRRLRALAGEHGLTDRELRGIATMATASAAVASSLKAITKDEYEQVEKLVMDYAPQRGSESAAAFVAAWRAKNPTLAAALDAKAPVKEDDPW